VKTVFDRLSLMLRDRDVAFEVLEHEPVFTSEEAARIRGTSLASGAKALICKADDAFFMFVLPADRRLASKEVRKRLGLRGLRFASREEVLEMTGLAPGSIPPFGSLFGLPTYCDEMLRDEAIINFNAGDHSISVSMAYEDFFRVEQPEIGPFAEVAP
jgi:Ala-tRNA(Pro) deacylase